MLLPRKASAPPRTKPSPPRRFAISESDDTARISWRWYRAHHLSLGAIGLFWGAIIAIVCGKLLASPGTSPFGLVFLAPHLGATLGLVYFTLTQALNRTTVEVSRERLTIRHGPLPWPGFASKSFPGHTLKQLYCERVTKGRYVARYAEPFYALNALDASGRKLELVSRLEEPEQALYLELALEKRLGIEDAPVEGELASRTRE